MRTQNCKQIKGIGFAKTRKAMSNVFLFIQDMCKVAKDNDIYPIGIIVDEGWSKDIDRREINQLFQRLDEDELSAIIFQNVHDVTDDEEDFRKFMQDMSKKSIVVVDMKTQKVFLPGNDGEGCDINE